MSRARLIRTVVLPLVVALLATAGLYATLRSRPDDLGVTSVETGQVVVAIKAVPARTLITGDMVGLAEVPLAYIASGSIRTLETCVGRVTLMPLASGEIVLTSKVSSSAPGSAGLSFAIPSGKRALTVQVDEVSGVAGFPQVGDRIDLLVTMAGSGPSATRRTRVLLENLNVLAVVQSPAVSESGLPRDLKGYTSLTLEVTLEQAATIVLAEDLGRLRAVLRPALETATIGDFDVTSDSLTQASKTLSLNAERAIGLDIRLIELDVAAASALSQGGQGDLLVHLDAAQLARLASFLASGQGRVLDRAYLTALNRASATYALLGEAKAQGTAAGVAGTPYGLSVTVSPSYYGQPYVNLEATIKLQIVDLATDARSPSSTTVVVRSMGRIEPGEGMAALGLVSATDLKPSSAGTTRMVLPTGMLSEAVISGSRIVVVAIVPSF